MKLRVPVQMQRTDRTANNELLSKDTGEGQVAGLWCVLRGQLGWLGPKRKHVLTRCNVHPA
jgi:hypothetical protein